ncbi:MAG: hypothetical protein ABSG99_04835 [Sedimentisphaerales bacterium]
MYDESFLNNLPNDPYEAAKLLCKTFVERNNGFPTDGARVVNYNKFIEAFAAMEAFLNATGLPFTAPPLGKSRLENILRIIKFFIEVRDRLDERDVDLTLVSAREKYGKAFGATFIYQFSDGDLKRIQDLLNELRDTITKSELFDAKHKQRILNKLEGLQSELHKKMSSLDKFWGLIGEAGVVLGKFGQDAKPLLDRIREIAQIVWRTQARAEELPSGTPFPLLTEGKKEDK